MKGIGNYMDEASVKFTILSSGVNTFVVTLDTSEYTFDGTEHKPNVTVKMEDRTLSEGTDYTLIYNNNVNAGTATVTVKGVVAPLPSPARTHAHTHTHTHTHTQDQNQTKQKKLLSYISHVRMVPDTLIG